jgi:hypothetical protein
MTATASGAEVFGWTLGVSPRIGVTIPTSKLGAMIVGGLELDLALPVAPRGPVGRRRAMS